MCTVSVLDDKDLWLPQVKIDVYTLLKKVNGVEIWTLCTVIAMDDKDLVDKINESSEKKTKRRPSTADTNTFTNTWNT